VVGPTTATPHHRTTDETKAGTKIEIEFTTRTRMRMERSILSPATHIRSRSRNLLRTPKPVESARRGVPRLVRSTGVRAGRAIMVLTLALALGALDRTRGCICIQIRVQMRKGRTGRVLKPVPVGGLI